MGTKVTARIGFAAVLASVVVALPSSVSAEPRAVHARSAGDHCLVGTWRARPAEQAIVFHHQLVEMHYGGGDYLHINAKGDVVDNFTKSRLLEGFPEGGDLKMHIRGVWRAHYHGLEGTSDAHGTDTRVLKATVAGWEPGSYIRATFNDKPVKFVFRHLNNGGYGAYRCSDTAFIEIDNDTSVDQTYSRRSFTP